MPPCDEPPLTEEAIRAAIDELARSERQEWIPIPLNVRGPPPKDTSTDRLRRAGASVVPALEAAIPGATGTGRVALTQMIQALDPERGEAVIHALRADPTPAIVNTCLCGFRTVGEWARNASPRQATIPPVSASSSAVRALTWILVISLVLLVSIVLAMAY